MRFNADVSVSAAPTLTAADRELFAELLGEDPKGRAAPSLEPMAVRPPVAFDDDHALRGGEQLSFHDHLGDEDAAGRDYVKTLQVPEDVLAGGSARSIAGILVEHVAGPDDDELFRSRATGMLQAVLGMLSHERDASGAPIDLGAIASWLPLPAIVAIADGDLNHRLPEEVRAGARSYIRSLPGFVDDRWYDQGTVPTEAHDLVAGRFVDALAPYAGDGGTKGAVPDDAGPIAYATARPDAIVETLLAGVDWSEHDPLTWESRAKALLGAIVPALVYRRDHDGMTLDGGMILDHMALRRIVDLASPRKHPGMPASVRKSVASYLASIPGYQADKGQRQRKAAHEHPQYLERMFAGQLLDADAE